MSTTKNKREQKKQLGQFLTPPGVATKILDKINIDADSVVLEPSFGNGSFIYAYINKLTEKGVDIHSWSKQHLYGCELDENMFNEFKRAWKYGNLPDNLFLGDFFRYKMPSFSRQKYFSSIKGCFDLVIGNPPFGGTID
ncbi:MAG: N-6 DNA methylase, partial [Alphaproteobacteria bacterium]|nr:N-6 DNA methylase [Alphaproteobacteria bacterium]